MSVVALFLVFSALLVLMGVVGRRSASALGAVPGMAEEYQRHRIAVIRRGATGCLVLGVLFAVLAVAAPSL